MLSLSLITAAILSAAGTRPADPATLAVRNANAERYAGDIEAAAGGDMRLAFALVATIEVETGFDPRLERCECRSWECDGGRAIGLGQIHRQWWAGNARSEICASNALSVSLIAKALIQLRRSRGGWKAAMRAYVGACPYSDPRVSRRVRLFERLLMRMQRAEAA